MSAAKMSTSRTLLYLGGLIACVLAASCRSPSAGQETRTAPREELSGTDLETFLIAAACGSDEKHE